MWDSIWSRLSESRWSPLLPPSNMCKCLSLTHTSFLWTCITSLSPSFSASCSWEPPTTFSRRCVIFTGIHAHLHSKVQATASWKHHLGLVYIHHVQKALEICRAVGCIIHEHSRRKKTSPLSPSSPHAVFCFVYAIEHICLSESHVGQNILGKAQVENEPSRWQSNRWGTMMVDALNSSQLLCKWHQFLNSLNETYRLYSSIHPYPEVKTYDPILYTTHTFFHTHTCKHFCFLV